MFSDHNEKLLREQVERDRLRYVQMARSEYQRDVSNVALSLLTSVIVREMPKVRASEFEPAPFNLQEKVDECVLVAKTFVDTVMKIDPPRSVLEAILTGMGADDAGKR